MNGEGGRVEPIIPGAKPSGSAIGGFDKLGGPRFLLTVDTEEEFDWSGPFTRDRHGLSHLKSVERFQAVCDGRRIRPLYLIDYPVAADEFGSSYFGALARENRAEIGLQLHPWVNPPFAEDVNPYNRYACNLSPQVERAKLETLYRSVVDRLGVIPDSYRAGRYGFGAATAAILADLGVHFDTSMRSLFDYSAQGGPNYATSPLMPHWLKDGKLIELPVTSVFAGALKRFGMPLFDKAFQSETMRAALARTGMLERIALTPEGIPIEKAILAVDIALEMQLPLLVFSFHSPSLAVGHTPYVQDEAALSGFYDWWDRVFDHLEQRGVRPTTIAELKSLAFDS